MAKDDSRKWPQPGDGALHGNGKTRLETEQPAEREIEPLLRGIGEIIGREAKKHGMGFALFMFDFEANRRMNYVSNAERESMLEALREFISRAEADLTARTR